MDLIVKKRQVVIHHRESNAASVRVARGPTCLNANINLLSTILRLALLIRCPCCLKLSVSPGHAYALPSALRVYVVAYGLLGGTALSSPHFEIIDAQLRATGFACRYQSIRNKFTSIILTCPPDLYGPVLEQEHPRASVGVQKYLIA